MNNPPTKIQTRNLELYDALLSFTKDTLELLSKEKNFTPLISLENKWVLDRRNNGYSRQPTQHFVWTPALFNLSHKIKSSEFTHITDLLLNDEIIAPQLNTLVGTYFGAMRIEPNGVIFGLMHEFLTDQGVMPFNLVTFNNAYHQLESAFYTDHFSFESLTPLCGFKMDSSTVVLSDDVSLVKLNEWEIIDLLNLGKKIGVETGNGRWIHDIHPYAIKTTHSLPKIVGKNTETNDIWEKYNHNRHEQAVINALRINKSGYFYPIVTVTKTDNVLYNGISYSSENPARRHLQKSYTLATDDVGSLKSLWESVDTIKLSTKSYLSLGIKRFSQSTQRDDIEDRIIDLMIAAESIFLTDGGGGELKYRLSHRASAFIQHETMTPKEIFDFMQKAYDVRSSIVHGNTPKLPKARTGETYTLETFSAEIESLLRISIRSILQTPSHQTGIDWRSIIFSTN